MAVPLSALVVTSKFKAVPSSLPEATVLRVSVVAHLRMVILVVPPAVISQLAEAMSLLQAASLLLV